MKTQQEKNYVSLELKKLSTKIFTERETAVSVIDIDAEPSADKPELQALIRKEAYNTTQDLRKVIEKLQTELNTLKNAKKVQPRGRGGASTTKINQPTTTISNLKQPPSSFTSKATSKKVQKQAKAKGKLAGKINKDTDNDNSKSKTNNGTKKSGRKPSKSPQRKRGKSPTSKQL